MAVVYCDEGLTTALRRRNGNSTTIVESLRLFTNDFTPDEGAETADFTEVGVVMGYLAKSLIETDWGYALDTGNHEVVATVTKGWTFTAGAGLTIYGWYLTNTGKTLTLMAERFASPVVIPAGGGTLSLTVHDTYKGCP